MSKKVCEKCGRQMEEINFYTYKNGQKFEQCKACITLHIDNFEPETFLWILQKADVPYVPQEWNVLRDKAYAKNPYKMNGMSVIGKYLSKMKLKQWKSYGWADSERLQEERAKRVAAEEQARKVQEQKVKEQFQNGEISEAQYRTLVSTKFQKQNESIIPVREVRDPVGATNAFRQENFLPEQEMYDPSSQLTLEDKKYLALKWGRTYTAADWLELEKTYSEMMQSFDIQDADSKNTLIFICKTTLKMNQALDCGDLDGYQKLSRVYDALRKSAKFTAAQNKEEKSQFVDSVGQIVAYCQKNGGRIPKFEIKTPADIVDRVIQDQKGYLKSLVYEDTALAKEIEDYLRAAKNAMNQKLEQEQMKQKGITEKILSDDEIQEYKEFLNQQKEITQQRMKEGGEETDDDGQQ